MRSIICLAFLTTITAFAAAQHSFGAYQRIARDVFGNIEKRQIPTCLGFGNTCADVCGPGYINCVSPSRCYNPSTGQQCCSNSEYCDAGTYCTDSGCCPNGSSLEECGASKSLSVIPPTATPSTSVTASAPRSSSTSIGSTIVKSSRSTTTSSSTSVKTYASSSLGATSTANKTSNPTVPSQPPSATANESQKLMSSIFGVVTGVAALLMIL